MGGVFVGQGDEVVLSAWSARLAATTGDGAMRVVNKGADMVVMTEVLQTGTVVRFTDLVEEHPLEVHRNFARSNGIHAAVHVPLRSGDLPLGIQVLRADCRPFTDDDVTVLQSFAAQAANALKSGRQQA